MKRIFSLMAVLALCSSLWAQQVLTVVYATSDDGFVNIRQRPSARAKKLGELWQLFHGLGGGILLEEQGGWSKVYVRGVVGWCNSKYVGHQTWYSGMGDSILIANKPVTELFTDNYADEGDLPLFGTVKKGTILGDEFVFFNGYYELRTGHDYIFIRKEDAIIKRR